MEKLNSGSNESLKATSGNQKSAAESDPVTVSYKDKSSGRVEIEAELCKGCMLCIEACPPGVLVISKDLNNMGYHPAEYTGERCTGCGICFYICPEPGSIRVYKRKRQN